jgi:outer membrane protein
MSWGRRLSLIIVTMSVGTGLALGQTPRRLTLKESQDIAVSNHPQVNAANFRAGAARRVTIETRSAYFPTLSGNLTGAGADPGSRIAAGALNNPVIFSRYSDGMSVSQLVSDFGRTGSLTRSSELQALSAGATVTATRADVLMGVDQAYYGALRAQSVLKVADETVKARETVLEQVSALEKSGLKSGLDVTFAQVNLDQARLLLLRAQNDLNGAYADLTAALGDRDDQAFDLVDEPVPGPLPVDLATLINEAMKDRPDLASLRFSRDASFKFADAEKALRLPTVSVVSSFGFTPFHDKNLTSHYFASGINISIPVFNGHLFSARREEAELRAQAADQTVRDLENRITRDVRVAWLNANTAYQSLGITAQLLDQATQSLDLAQARYNLGLSSIVELSQAELNLTEAEIAQASAKYEYQVRRAELNYRIGALQ